LPRSRGIELEQVFRLPCPNITVRQYSFTLPAAIRIAESGKADAVGPLDDALLDQD
jgi:hypothetical protein